MSEPQLINYTQYVNNRNKKFLYVKDIKHTLKYYNLDPKGKKPDLLKRLDDYFLHIKSFNKYNSEIISIQKFIRGFLVRKKIKSMNQNYFLKHKCCNKEDFYTFESIDDIDPLYFYSYKDINGFFHFFDIRSFELLIKNKSNNPYNRLEIPLNIIEDFKNRYKIVKEDKNFKPFESKKLTEEEKYSNYVMEVFQSIDETNCLAQGTNIDWFKNLSINQLVNLFKVLEDVWNYRANLTKSQQDEIVPEGNMFKILPFNLPKDNKFKRKVQYIILDEMKKLVTSSDKIEHRATGAYYILIALVEISTECAEAMPWLIQY